MNARQFFDKVAELRQAQKEYFKTRSSQALSQSKFLEREIDNEIRRVKEIENKKQQELVQTDLKENRKNNFLKKDNYDTKETDT